MKRIHFSPASALAAIACSDVFPSASVSATDGDSTSWPSIVSLMTLSSFLVGITPIKFRQVILTAGSGGKMLHSVT